MSSGVSLTSWGEVVSLALVDHPSRDKLGWLNWFWQFLCEMLSFFYPKRFLYAWSCRLCERRISFCMGLISGKLSGFLLMFLTRLTLLSVLLFFLYRSPSSLLCTIFYSISSNIDKLLFINPSANVFVLEALMIIKGWLIYSGANDRPGEVCYKILLRWLTLLLRSLTHIHALLDLFLLLLFLL